MSRYFLPWAPVELGANTPGAADEAINTESSSTDVARLEAGMGKDAFRDALL